MVRQISTKIKKVAMELDRSLEKGHTANVMKFFSKDCEVEFFGTKMKGHREAGKWINWIFNHFEKLKFKPITIMVDKDKFFEEFELRAKTHDGREVHSKMAEVLTFKDYKVKKLNLYFDMMEFMHSGGSLVRKMVIRILAKKATEGLK